MLVDLPRTRIQDLFQALAGAFYVDQDALRAAVEAESSFNVIHLGLYQKVDLFVAGEGPLDMAQLERAVPRRLAADSPREFPVTSAERVVLRELDGFRKSDTTSQRQWRDVQAVLRVQRARMDVAAMRELAQQTRLAELLERAVAEAWGSAPS